MTDPFISISDSPKFKKKKVFVLNISRAEICFCF